MSLLRSLFILLFVAAVGFLLAREAYLWYAAALMKNEAKVLIGLARQPSNFFEQCLQMGSTERNAIPSLFQLRFTSDRDYQIEVICPSFPSSPIIQAEGSLPEFIQKSKGSSGLVAAEYSALGLEFLGRKTIVAIEDQVVRRKSFDPNWGAKPTTSCVGYGYSCCEAALSIGEGAAITGTLDCPKACFFSCRARPVILSFTSFPFVDVQSQSVSATAQEEIRFNYVIDPGKAPLKSVIIDFGDGQSETFTETSGTTAHRYSCNQTECHYSATVVATDEEGISSADTAVGRIKLVIRQ